MDEVKQVSKRKTITHTSAMDHCKVQKSTTLNRRFVKKPTVTPKITTSAASASRAVRRQQAQQTQQRQLRRRVMLQKQNTVNLQPTKNFAQTQPQRRTQAQQSAQQQRAVLAKQQQQAQQQQQRQVARQGVAQRKQIIEQGQQQVQRHQTAQVARARMAARKAAASPEHLSAQELKERAIQQALRKVDQLDKGDKKTMAAQMVGEPTKKTHFWQGKNFGIAAAMAVVSIALLGYLVALNLPDISVRVAAMQTGIEKIYPSYVPSNYRLDGLVKEDAGRVTMNFKNDDGKTFTLVEEKSSWDSKAVLSNYVKKNWGTDYTITKGQGLTIYVLDSKAAWVNGGVFYVITDENNILSSTDLHDIAVSL